ncbi:hypothetical protein B0T26DRAFT_657262 [Lasiosphaeria miniovina]|uniref:ATP-dependent bile acid permease n=1 Tax=Lasiosphaeria miniovina TaxID=1954250 RepID=A0AA39ZUJ5_9PEZI|nr:uncharacterized protein B0T26DRAFT_657262 [Lasiosphaeria miniovina]KAK0703815.1 hypothetical protein B0T26DRAFT_657262 [Lasiosphaeria miniovina]
MDQNVAREVARVVAAVCVGLLTAPAISYGWKMKARLGGYVPVNVAEHYEDRDGVATEASTQSYSDMKARIAVWLGVCIGLVSSFASRVVALTLLQPPGHQTGSSLLSKLSSWADLLSWVFLSAQCACFPAQHQYLERFRLTVFGLFSSLLLAASVALRHGQYFTSVQDLLCLAQLVSAVSAACAFASFPRRPDVYHRGQLVDQQYTVSLLAFFLFSWNQAVFGVTKERQMEIEDMPGLDFRTRSTNLQSRFLEGCGDGPLWRKLVRFGTRDLALQWSFTLLLSLLSMFPQLVLFNFLSTIESRQGRASSHLVLYLWVSGLLASQFLQAVATNMLKWVTVTRLEIPVGSLLQSLVFSKALRQYDTAALHPVEGEGDNNKRIEGASRKKKGDRRNQEAGQSVVALAKLDSSIVANFCQYNKDLPMALSKLALVGGFLVHLMGWMPVLCGMGATALVLPLSIGTSRKLRVLNASLMKSRDGKTNLLDEALQGIRQIKYSALEPHLEEKILANRNDELKQLRKVSMWQCLHVFLTSLGPLLLASIAFFVYLWQQGTQTKASVVFTALGLFGQLEEAVRLLPPLHSVLLQAWTSASRLEKYLGQPDKGPGSEPGKAIAFKHATVIWPSLRKTETPAEDLAEQPITRSRLTDVTLEFPNGELSVVTGKTGSGKSLLLAAILGEARLVAGRVYVPSPPLFMERPESIPDSQWVVPQLTCLVSQTPWIESGTLRDNILFGLPFVERRYRKAIAACALEKDIELLADGDSTEVGSRGVILSGGQRWRVALARALYSRAGILVLDDVLSAVDAHVARYIVDEALSGELAHGRTRILATHHPELVLSRASFLVHLRGGHVESAGSLLSDYKAVAFAIASATELVGKPSETGQLRLLGARENTGRDRQDKEKRQTGPVNWGVYKAYFEISGGALFWGGGIAVILFLNLLGVARTWSLKEVSQHAAAGPKAVLMSGIDAFRVRSSLFDRESGARGSETRIGFWMTAYVGFGFFIAFLEMLRVMVVFHIGLKASKLLFQRMVHAVLRAPLRWINKATSGRILNRFISDMTTMDMSLAQKSFALLNAVLSLVIIIGAGLSVSFSVTFVSMLLFVYYIRTAQQYMDMSREVKRLNSISHSPIYDHVSSVLSGLSTIRAFRRTHFYMDRMCDLIDDSSRVSWSLCLSNRWRSLRMGTLGAFFVSAVASAVAITGVDVAQAGFSLSFALRYTKTLTSLLQALTYAELGFNSCERVMEYAAIETEPEGGQDPPAGWPSEGKIAVDNLTAAYSSDIAPVLKDLTFVVRPGERFGIVGRTGAGKSTLAAVLFRLLEPSSGAVCIDNIDISTLKLTGLRSRLAIIPQDPFLFSGTLRSSLLPAGKALGDDILLAALRRVNLIDPRSACRTTAHHQAGNGDAEAASTSLSVSYPTDISPTDQPTWGDAPTGARSENSPPAHVELSPGPESSKRRPQSNTIPDNTFAGLSTPISQGGRNLSQGQRQLVCLARALLTRPRILVLDEATSAVDHATDAALQASLRREFATTGCTVIVIAHRLSTIADFDRILVLEKGQVAEIGSPRELFEEGQRLAAAKEADIKTPSDGADIVEDKGKGKARGAFYELVQKSADRDSLMNMILCPEKGGT